ncbi:M23 family peptidase [Cohnella faecalis]|uniref:M23 family peptidase n=1 Tax=Cohnella faecalis TaxID=2315694 RepID=A0A398CLK1_9BACL|nr:M23 family peptidase [Cohnella faecalis]
MFAICWGWIRSDIPGGEEARQWTVRAVTQDMDFEAVEAWYGQTFGGSPSFLPSFRGDDPAAEASAGWSRDATVLPVDGRVVQSFAQSDTGIIQIAAPLGSDILAVHAGRVTQVTTDNGGKATIIVQHSNRVMTVYGDISSPVVKTNDWVQAGQKLGVIGAANEDAAAIGDRDGEGTLRFAVKQNNNYLDPAEVIPFD